MAKTLTLAPDPVCDTEAVRVAAYTRISTAEERQPNSLEAQRVRLESFVSSQPEWGIERRYEDQFTGAVIDRPALTRMLRDAKLGRFDVLLVYRVDRLARSIKGLAQISKRAANPAEYLLTGRVRCGRCGQAYVGTAAHGRNGRYTYYTCFTRAREATLREGLESVFRIESG
jgi:Resolvase, N terminal domain/Recombinase zinc beta ribbon domain